MKNIHSNKNPNWKGGRIEKRCIQCEKVILLYPYQIKIGEGKYCSRSCRGKYRALRDHKIPIGKGIKGIIPSLETIEKMSESHKGKTVGKQNGNWKGNKVSYKELHSWVARWLGKPDICEFCGKFGLTGKNINWANKSREYKRDLSDWLRLCIYCHRQYDRNFKSKLVYAS